MIIYARCTLNLYFTIWERPPSIFFFFFFNDPAPPKFYPLPLPDPFPICPDGGGERSARGCKCTEERGFRDEGGGGVQVDAELCRQMNALQPRSKGVLPPVNCARACASR